MLSIECVPWFQTATHQTQQSNSTKSNSSYLSQRMPNPIQAHTTIKTQRNTQINPHAERVEKWTQHQHKLNSSQKTTSSPNSGSQSTLKGFHDDRRTLLNPSLSHAKLRKSTATILFLRSSANTLSSHLSLSLSKTQEELGKIPSNSRSTSSLI